MNLSYRDSTETDAQNNQHKEIGSYITTDNQTHALEDVWFSVDAAHTQTLNNVSVTDDIAALPDLPGFGNLRSLHQAMATDQTGALINSVQQWMTSEPDSSERYDLLMNMIYHWAGVQDIAQNSRGAISLDSRKLEVLEKLLGEKYLNIGNGNFVGRNAVNPLIQSFNLFSDWVELKLNSQIFDDTYALIGMSWDNKNNQLKLDVSKIVQQWREQYNLNPNIAASMSDFARVLTTQGSLGQALMTQLRQAGNQKATEGFDFFLTNLGQYNKYNIGSNIDSNSDNIMVGDASNNIFYGLFGNDQIFGDLGDDTLNGGDGADYLDGSLGADLMIGGTGDDTYIVDDANDKITEKFNEGIDTVETRGINYSLGANIENLILTGGLISATGNGLNNSITSNYANNIINGGAGDDFISIEYIDNRSSGYKNTLTGGRGNDTFISMGCSTDLYIFNRGDGQDIIEDYEFYEDDEDFYDSKRLTIDRIKFGAGISANNLSFSQINYDLIIQIKDPNAASANDQITVKDWFYQESNQIEILQFSDGAQLTANQVTELSRTIYGTENSDTLKGSNSDNTIFGFGGNDTITDIYGNDTIDGGAGDDIILDQIINIINFYDTPPINNNFISGGDGNDIITTSNRSNDRLNGNDGNDTITDLGGNDTIQGGAGDDIITDKDTYIDQYTDIKSFFASINLLMGGEGNDRIYFSYNSNNTLDGGAGDDIIQKTDGYGAGSEKNKNTFIGGLGNDTLISDGTADTYIFNRGDGQDVIFDEVDPDKIYINASAGQDQIRFGTGITSSDLSISRNNDSLIIKIQDPNHAASNDQITIQNWFSEKKYHIGEKLYQIETLKFADGAQLTANQLTELSRTIYGTENSDTLDGSKSDNLIFGFDGNDNITDPGGNDTIDGGAGNDIIVDQGAITGRGPDTNLLRGGEGNDTITFSYKTNNTIMGDAGDDILQQQNSDRGIPELGIKYQVNTLAGGTGNDTLKSGGTTDFYIFNRGDGQDIIEDYGANSYNENANETHVIYQTPVGQDQIQFGAEIAPNDLNVNRNNDDLIIKIQDPNNASNNDQITIQNWFKDEIYQIETFQFADNTVLNKILLGTDNIDSLTGTDQNDYLSGLVGADTLTGGKGNDIYIVDNIGDNIIENLNGGTDTIQSSVTYTLAANVENLTLTGSGLINGIGNAFNNILTGNAANNTLDGKTGADTLMGGAGDDTYLFDVDGGKDTIIDTGGNDIFIFGAGINANQIWLQHTGNNLVATRIGTGDTASFKDWYLNSATNNTHIEILKSGDGKTLLDTQVENLVQAMASFAVPATGQTTLPTSYQTVLNPLIAANWL